MPLENLRTSQKQHGVGGGGESPHHHGVDIVFGRFGVVSPDDVLSLDGRSGFRVGDDDRPGVFRHSAHDIAVADGLPGDANIHALEAFGTDPALEASGGFRHRLFFTQPQRRFGEARPAGRRVGFRHHRPRTGRNVRSDHPEVPVFGTFECGFLNGFARKRPVYRSRRLAPRSHGLHHGAWTAGEVSRRIKMGNSSTAIFVDHDVPAGSRLDGAGIPES